MKVSYNTNGLRHLTIKEALKTVRNHNYDGVELSFHENHLHPLMTTRKEVEELKTSAQTTILLFLVFLLVRIIYWARCLLNHHS